MALDPQRISAIAASIRNACTPILGADETTRDAKDVAKAAGESASGLRETIMSSVATMSAADNWTFDEVKVAAKAASDASNSKTDKALQTFIGEVKRAAHPLVRGHFEAILALRNAAWEDEQESLTIDKAAPAPIKKAVARKYHLLTAIMGGYIDNAPLITVDDVVGYAKAHDPDHDAAKVHKRLLVIHGLLAAFVVDFPVDDLGLCVDTIAGIKVEELTAARQRVLATTVAGTAPVVAQPDPAKLAAALIPAATVEDTIDAALGAESEPATGAVDILDDILGDMTGEEVRLAA